MSDAFCIEPQPGEQLQAEITDLTVRVAALEASSPVVPEIAGATLAIGTSLQRVGSQMVAEDGSYQALRDAFAGFAVSAAAGPGLPVNVAGNGGIATGLSGIVAGSGYYVSAGVLIAAADLPTWLATATPGAWYRFVGTGRSSTEIKQAWGEPQQV